MLKRITSILGSAAVALLLAAQFVAATQVLYRTPQQLGAESELVVMGKVESVESFWNDSRTKILTEARVTVSDRYKGSAPGVVSVMQLGGVVGKVRMSVHGSLQWHEGEEVVLFLEPFRNGSYQVAGFTQGKFNVQRDPVTGQTFVVRPATEGVQLVGAPGGSTTDASRTRKQTVNSFINDALGRR